MTMMFISQASDESLLNAARAGDARAYGLLYRRHQARVFRVARWLTGSEDAACDVTQEVFVRLIEGRLRYEPKLGALGPFLLGVARNVARRRDPMTACVTEDDADNAGVWAELVDDAADPLAHLDRAQTVTRVKHAVEQLPAHYREALVLVDLEEMSYDEAALALGCPVGTVRSRLNRARGLLARELAALRATEVVRD